MISLIQGLVVLVVWYAVVRAVLMVMKDTPESKSVCVEIVGYITFGMVAIEIALLVGFIYI
tara:strand:- start:2103 stop:2285 length:183 start_codon:yes stop_codon:yes gene_type:complete